jgi:hypothetical protein
MKLGIKKIDLKKNKKTKKKNTFTITMNIIL